MGMRTMPMAMMTFMAPSSPAVGVNMIMMTMASRKTGKARMRSMVRMMRVSALPP